MRVAREALLWVSIMFLLVSGYYQRQMNREVIEIMKLQRSVNKALHERIVRLEPDTVGVRR